MYKIGVDLGGTNIAVGLVDESMRLVAKVSAPTRAERPGEAIAADIAALCRRICKEHGITLAEVASVGVAAPGTVNTEAGVVKYANNLPFHDFPLAELLKKDLGVGTVKVANDADAAAWGEAMAGAAKGTKTSVMVTLGTGVGGGIVVNGQLFCGAFGGGAELGHIVIEVDGIPCTCGRQGCWEVYSSATALIRMTKEKIDECAASGRDTSMSGVSRVTGRTACDAMRAGDAAAKEVYDRYIKYLASGLASMINIFQPEVISLGGGISGEGQSLVKALYPIVATQVYGGERALKTELRIAELGNDAGIIGGALLA